MNDSLPDMNSDSQREAALFQAAVQLIESARASFLDGACHGDLDLRSRLDALLAAHEQSRGVLEESDSPARLTMKLDLANTSPDETVGQNRSRPTP